ncbi:MAG: class A beta-lactamase-related serine hydrolase [Ignavibacteriales bacterium]|nr:MAG: class A beta-lactamase-related serine hydrolase [Ignavibacteriales bacterium]
MKFLIAHLVILLLMIACEQPIENSSLSLAEQNSSIIAEVVQQSFIDHNVPGILLLLKFEDGSIFKDAFGYSDLRDSAIIKTSQQFRIGSVTKTMIGTAVLILVDRNIIKFENTLEELLPGVITRGNEITLMMLLNHSSAIPNYTNYDAFLDIYSTNPTYEWTPKVICDLFRNEELLDTPGEKSYYSNSNYYLLGLIIEKFSNKPLTDFLRDEIFHPLKMYSTYLPETCDLNGNVVRGYLDINNDGIISDNEDFTSQAPYSIWAAGGVVSTIDDLLIWTEELMAGTLLSSALQATRNVIDVPVAEAPIGVNYGLGISDIFGAIGHTGAVAGYSTIIFNYKKTTFIAFGNSYETANESGLIAEDLFEKLKNVLFN